MDAQAEQLLLDIGNQLDAGIFPRVKIGGVVMPGEPSRPLSHRGKEKADGERQERQGSRQPEQPGPRRGGPRPGPGELGEPRSPGRPRPAGETAPVVSALGQYEQEVGALQAIYPGAQQWTTQRGLWLVVPASLLPGLREHAVFLVGASSAARIVRSWAFWADPMSLPTWIGPRHTNFGDGSICAFEPADGTWNFGDPLLDLIDIYTVWALRHLHLRHTGRWPGPQSVHRPYERLLEIRLDERCGCSAPRGTYGQCCRPRDLDRDRIADAVDFAIFSGWEIRHPPAAVEAFMSCRSKHISLLDGLI